MPFKSMNLNTTKVYIIHLSCSMIKCVSTYFKLLVYKQIHFIESGIHYNSRLAVCCISILKHVSDTLFEKYCKTEICVCACVYSNKIITSVLDALIIYF